MTPYGNPPDWSALIDEHDQLTPEERRQHQQARLHEEDPELRVRTATGATIATQPIPRHTPEPGAAQRGVQREICLVHLLPEPCPTCAAYIAAGL